MLGKNYTSMTVHSKKLINAFIFLVVFLIIINIAFSPQAIFTNVLNSLELWVFKVYPPIFIFYILSSLIINVPFFHNRVSKLFRIINFRSSHEITIFSLSLFLGNPATSALISENIHQNKIKIEDGNKLLCISSFLNPLFIISFLGSTFNNYKITIAILLIHILSNFILAYFVLRNNSYSNSINHVEINHSNLIIEIFDSIERANYLLIKVCGIIVTSNLCKFAIQNILIKLNLHNPLVYLFLALIEVTSGLYDIINLNLPVKLTLSLIAFLISFGGLSIHLQVYAMIINTRLSFKRFFLFRMLQGLISFILCFIVFSI